MSALRTSIVRAPAAVAGRRVAGRAAAPVLRRRIWSADHPRRLRWVRRLIPGSIGQIPSEILGFAEFAAPRDPVRICEIGTLMGGTSMFLASLAPSVRTFLGVDLEPTNASLVAALAPPAVTVEFLRGSSRDAAIRDRVEAALGGELLDLLFVDGDHAYPGVKADFVGYRDLVRPGGLIAFHDIVADHRGRVGSPSGPWAGDVPVLWGEIRERFRHWEFVDDRDQDGFGIGVIEHDPTVTV